MAGSLNDRFTRVTDSDTGRPVISTLASSKSVGATSVTIGDATNWTTTTKVHFSIYTTLNVAGSTVKDTSSQTDWIGTLSGTTISNVSLTGGTDRTYNAGSIVEMTPSSKWAKDLFDGLSVAHNTDGTLKPNVINATNLLTDSVVTDVKIASVGMGKLTNPSKFSVYRTASANLTVGSEAIFLMDTKEYDTGSNFNVTTGLFTASASGLHHFDFTVSFIPSAGNNAIYVVLYKNGSPYRRGGRVQAAYATSHYMTFSCDIQLSTGDTVAPYYFAGIATSIEAGPGQNWFQGHFVSQ